MTKLYAIFILGVYNSVIKMKHIVFLGVMFLCSGKLFATGYEVSVCESLDVNSRCIGKNDVFHYPGDKMKLHIWVHNKVALGTSKIIYKVYTMANDHDGEIYAELSSFVRPEWFAISKDVTFVKPGYYKIEVYLANKTLINSQFITITDR